MFSPEFLLTSLIVVLMPGTGVIYTVSTGLFLGRRASIAAAAGCTAGILPHMTAGILGLSAIWHAGAVVFQCVKFIGALYLMYLAWSMWRETGALSFSSRTPESRLLHIARRGFLINILNPKLSIFFLAFLPLFVSPDAAAPTLEMLLLGIVFMAMTLGVFILYGLGASVVSRQVAGSQKLISWLRRSFAAVFALLGLKLATAER